MEWRLEDTSNVECVGLRCSITTRIGAITLSRWRVNMIKIIIIAQLRTLFHNRRMGKYFTRHINYEVLLVCSTESTEYHADNGQLWVDYEL